MPSAEKCNSLYNKYVQKQSQNFQNTNEIQSYDINVGILSICSCILAIIAKNTKNTNIYRFDYLICHHQFYIMCSSVTVQIKASWVSGILRTEASHCHVIFRVFCKKLKDTSLEQLRSIPLRSFFRSLPIYVPTLPSTDLNCPQITCLS